MAEEKAEEKESLRQLTVEARCPLGHVAERVELHLSDAHITEGIENDRENIGARRVAYKCVLRMFCSQCESLWGQGFWQADISTPVKGFYGGAGAAAVWREGRKNSGK